MDDDADSLDLLAFVLSEYGAEVTAVVSASEALEIFAQLKPDLLIFDISMPEVDGYALLSQIRNLQDPNDEQILAIALTAMAANDARLAAMAAGFQIYLTKPFDLASLVTAVAQLAALNWVWGGANNYVKGYSLGVTV